MRLIVRADRIVGGIAIKHFALAGIARGFAHPVGPAMAAAIGPRRDGGVGHGVDAVRGGAGFRCHRR